SRQQSETRARFRAPSAAANHQGRHDRRPGRDAAYNAAPLEDFAELGFHTRVAVNICQYALAATTQPDAGGALERLEELRVIGLSTIARVQHGDRRQRLIAEKQEVFVGLVAIGTLSGGGNVNNMGIRSPGQLDETKHDA